MGVRGRRADGMAAAADGTLQGVCELLDGRDGGAAHKRGHVEQEGCVPRGATGYCLLPRAGHIPATLPAVV